MHRSGLPNKRRTVGAIPEEGHEVDKGSGAFCLLRQTKKIQAVQTGEEKVAWRPYSIIPVP